MSDPYADDPVTYRRIPLSDVSMARLMEIAAECHQDPDTVLAAIVNDVLKDDEDAHYPGQAPSTVTLQ